MFLSLWLAPPTDVAQAQVRQIGEGPAMTYRRIARWAAPLVLALATSACALIPEGESVCPDQGPNSGSWPYCAPSEPGGPGPVDDRIDPTGRSIGG